MPLSSRTEITRYRRLRSWNYSRGATLFITIVTALRQQVFGRIVDGEMKPSPLGEKVKEALVAIPRLNSGIQLFGHVVMPDHVHFNVHIKAGLEEPLKVLGRAIARFKNYTTKQAKLSLAISTTPQLGSVDGRAVPGLWQQGYHDRLCLSRNFIDSTERYIAYNVLKWELMYGQPHTLRIQEPLDLPCLNVGEYWKGVGNVDLLKGKIVSLRVSRHVSSAEQIASVVTRMRRAVEEGFVILSGYVSPGEKAVRDMLCSMSNARFIRILPTYIPNAPVKPESRYVPAFTEGRYLEIAKGNDEITFGRDVCLDYNADIVQIANASAGGMAIYWQVDGAHRLYPSVSADGQVVLDQERKLCSNAFEDRGLK